MEQLKTLGTLGRELAMGSQGVSKEFIDLVKGIGECKSKFEEDRIIVGEMERLRKKIGEPDIPKKKMKEFILRLVYIELLGHDASFGYIHAVKMTHDDNLLLKRTGYLAVTLFLPENHDLIILIVNTIQKDLKSDNHLVVCAALSAVCKLISEETIPAVLQQVVDLLNHPKEVVRKKAIMALHRFYQRSPSAVSHVVPKFRQVLTDKDPSVMSAAVCALHDLITEDAKAYKNLLGSFLSILKQVAESRLPTVYDYHKTPAPFVQIKLLKVLALLGANDKAASEHMYSVLADVLRRADPTVNIGNAIVYECCCTITTIFPNDALLGMCAEAISRFLKSDSHNLKYMGIDALGRIVKISPTFGTEHQLAVMDCLEDPDLSLQLRTLELLYSMTGPANVQVVCERMMDFLKSGKGEEHARKEIANRIADMAEKFAPDNKWFILTMTGVLEVSGNLVKTSCAHDLMRLIAEGSAEDESADRALREYAVQMYLKLLNEPKLPSILLQVICWVLGEYATLEGAQTPDDVIARLCDVADSQSEDDTVRGYVISAITKILSFEITAGRQPTLLPECLTLVEELSACQSTDLQQRAYQLRSLLALSPASVAQAVPADASCEDIQVDPALPFLDGFVQAALGKGAKSYLPTSQRDSAALSQGVLPAGSGQEAARERSLRFEAYEKPSLPAPRPATLPAAPVFQEERSLALPGRPLPVTAGETGRRPGRDGAEAGLKLKLEGVQRKWGRPSFHSGESEAASKQEAGPLPAADGIQQLSSSYGQQQSGRPRGSRAAHVPEVSEEKKRLAASLFGGGSSAVVEEKKREVSAVKRSVVQSQAAPPQPPPPDLLDFGSEEPSAAPAVDSQPKSDPFMELEELLTLDPPGQVPAASAGSSTQVKAEGASVDLMTLYDEIAKAHVGNGEVAGGSREVKGGSGRVDAALKGPSVLERDAKARLMGVVPGGENPELLKGIFS